MPNTTGCRFGQIVLVPFPFTDQTRTKKRPAVVVSSDAYHRWRIDVVVMAVTSQVDRAVHASGDVPVVEWQDAGLIKPPLVKPVFATIERRIILRTLGERQPRDQRAVKEALHVLLG